MNEKFLMLMEKYFDGKLTKEESSKFDEQLNSNKEYRLEFEEQKRIKEVFKKMKLKNPSAELWDGYWEKTYNRVERGLGWLAIFVGALILLGFASVEFVNQLYADNSTPILIRIGVVSLVFGLLVLLFSVIREKLFTYKSDKYKEIQR
jgi:ABC-type bacteriocin/lantibiotic exporter with double-glycine peptidase domain